MDDFAANFAFVVYDTYGKLVSWARSADKEEYARRCGWSSKAEMIAVGKYPVDQYTILPNPNHPI